MSLKSFNSLIILLNGAKISSRLQFWDCIFKEPCSESLKLPNYHIYYQILFSNPLWLCQIYLCADSFLPWPEILSRACCNLNWSAFWFWTIEGSLGGYRSKRHTPPEPDREGKLWLASKGSLPASDTPYCNCNGHKWFYTNNLAPLLLRRPRPAAPWSFAWIQRGEWEWFLLILP